jgi:uncharacterized membrane protein
VTITLHALSARTLKGSLTLAAAVGVVAAVAGRAGPNRELALALAWDAGVLTFLALMLRATTRYSEDQMARKARHRAPTSGVLALVATVAAGFAIYAIFLLIDAAGAPEASPARHLLVGAVTTALSWALVHVLFAMDYARVYYAGARSGAPPADGLAFPGGHQPDYGDFLYFAFVIGVACQTADVAITSREMRKVALAHGLLAFVFNTVILAALVNVAAALR